MRSRFLVAGALAALLATAFSTGTAAAAPSFSLRVEAPGTTLEPGARYAVRGTVGVPRGETAPSGACVRAPGRFPLGGSTALGLIASASNGTKALQPLWVVEDSFGKRVCRIGGFEETDTPFTGWLYRVNHVAPSMGAELVSVTPADEVLWVFANFGTGANTGDELVLTAPARATPGLVQVSVNAVTYDGNVDPAPDGTVVSGGTAPVATVGGQAAVPVVPGNMVLRAAGPGAAPTEIPSNQAKLCVAAALKDCPAQPGRQIVGTNLADRVKGGPGPDLIRTRGGPDKVVVRGGWKDRVDCGKGKDVVIADGRDRVRRCEKVRRR